MPVRPGKVAWGFRSGVQSAAGFGKEGAMTRFGRGVLLVGTPLVMLAVIGAVYFQIYTSSHTTREAWMVTHSVVAGTQLNASNVQRVTVGGMGTAFALSSENPISEKRRAGHAMQPSHLLAADDLLPTNAVVVPISFAAQPQLQAGDRVDVYLVAGGRSVQVGRSLVVQSDHALWVAAADEPYWVALEANKAVMVAVRSSGIGVPVPESVGVEDAAAALNESAGGSGVSPNQPAPGGSAAAPTPAPPARGPAPTSSPAPAPAPSAR